jgi:hypothetical protein
MGSSWIWAGLLPFCGLAGWLIVRRPMRCLVEARDAERAREAFRRQREHLEAGFVARVVRAHPIEAVRWEEARWGDEIVWARDRQTRNLLALIGVELDEGDFGGRATAVFEYRGRRWTAEGRHLDAVEPYEAFYRLRDFEPIVLPQRRPL